MSWGIQLLTYRGGGRRENREREGGGTETHWDERDSEEARRKETTHSAEEGVAEKHPRTERCGTEMDTEGGREAGTSQSQSRTFTNEAVKLLFGIQSRAEERTRQLQLQELTSLIVVDNQQAGLRDYLL